MFQLIADAAHKVGQSLHSPPRPRQSPVQLAGRGAQLDCLMCFPLPIFLKGGQRQPAEAAMSLYSAVGGHWLGKPRHPAPRSLPGGLPAGFPEVDLPFGVRVWRRDQNFAISSQHVHRLSGPRKESSRGDDFTKAVGRLLPAVPVASGPVTL